jgi:hypothetical protein
MSNGDSIQPFADDASLVEAATGTFELAFP